MRGANLELRINISKWNCLLVRKTLRSNQANIFFSVIALGNLFSACGFLATTPQLFRT